ncbi:unnamed protein product [Pseudo-nitzschia multistriata]|uniref:PKD domain-containing protein n=1 Tax=Pseudo-nitzschia multistriata TaxID=183589 RepID=A0A448ZFP0_9STRA|nr:unnamed protein product [Pseudo-nitzschia multistriata]
MIQVTKCRARAFCALLLLRSIAVSLAGVLHDGFISEVVTSTKAMSGTFLPNPRNGDKPMMILNSKNGQIYVLENPDESPDSIEIMDLSDGSKLCNNGERGLHTVIPSPEFTKNRHVFAFFTLFREDCLEDPQDGPHNVVMRFTMDPETLMLDYDEGALIFRGPPMDERLHNGGAMAFGNDGKLYITMGDAGKRKNADPLDNVHGSIIRLNEDGSVPDDNPYTKTSGYENSYRCADTEGRVPTDAPNDSVCAEVWANGLRNPFRIDMDPNVKDKVRFSFGVVGAQHMEALYYGGTDYKGTNYGWPKYEGVCRPGDMGDCNPLDDDPTLTMPFHWYEHISYNDGGCIGGQAHVPEGIWPSQFKYLFLDFILLKIYALEENRPDKACWECDPPLAPTHNETFYRSIQKEGDNINEARMVEMWFGPYKDTQALYVTKYGNLDNVIRIRYTGILNKPPTPSFDYEIDGDASVTFDASNTTDAEDDQLTYTWDFGDETEVVVVDEKHASHQYSEPGEYQVTLAVTDTSGQKQQVSKTVKIGTVPSVSIISPPPNATFGVGKVLRLKGEAFDFLGNLIPDDKLTWEVRQHHANHFHPFLDHTRGNDLRLYAAPEPEDFFAATNSFLKVILTAEDEYGLTETVSVDVQPNIIMVNVTTQPSGLKVVVDDYDIDAPQLITSWKGFKLPVSVADQPPYIFKKWSDDRTARTRVFPIYQKDGDPMPQVRAIFCADLGTQCKINEDCCSGYCSEGVNNVCAPASMMPFPVSEPTPQTFLRPTYVEVPDPPPSDLEIDVFSPPSDSRIPPLEIDPKPHIAGESSTSENSGISIGLLDSDSSTNLDDEGSMYSTITWVLALLVVLVGMGFGCCVWKRYTQIKNKDHVGLATKCKHQKRYYDYESEGAGSNTGVDEYYDDEDIKVTDTGSTEESEDLCNETASPLSQSSQLDQNNISLSFLVTEHITSGVNFCIDDVENQASVAIGATVPLVDPSTSQSYLMPPLSPASSVENSMSNDSSEIEKGNIETVPDFVPDKSFAGMDALQNHDKGGRTFSVPLSKENQVSEGTGSEDSVEEEIGDVNHILDLLLVNSPKSEGHYVNSPETNSLPGEDISETNPGDCWIPSQSTNKKSTTDEAKGPSKVCNFEINSVKNIAHGNNQCNNLLLLNSPALQSRAQTEETASATFMSPDVYHEQKPESETPETLLLSYNEKDSFVENSTSFEFSEPQTT